ncbi:hypothetical protein DL96DRAFT_1715987 [Flagelloscypha sp. PMI_526]|nr:hypothetical protein DL96DRAFT_1715987 [Flagelloscypha sp. PMI_526]
MTFRLPTKMVYQAPRDTTPRKHDVRDIQFDSDPMGRNPSVPWYLAIFISPTPTYQKSHSTRFLDGHVEKQSPTEAYKIPERLRPFKNVIPSDSIFHFIAFTYKLETITTSASLIMKPTAAALSHSILPPELPIETLNNDRFSDWSDGSNGGSADWTAMEDYLAFMSDLCSFVNTPSATVTTALALLAAVFVSPMSAASGTTKGTVIVSGSTATYIAESTSGIDKITLSIKDTEGRAGQVHWGGNLVWILSSTHLRVRNLLKFAGGPSRICPFSIT